MANKMLIDASHPEETRVVVLRGNRVEEFDFESADKKPLRGNIYLAKVTRVEPSLQAAFVDYGGNRHGFLAFSEIHPDYYQIPVSDRQALLDEDAAAHRDEDDEERPNQQRRSRRHWRGKNGERAEKRRANGDETLVGKEDAEFEGENAEASGEFAAEANAPVPSDEMQPLLHFEPREDEHGHDELGHDELGRDELGGHHDPEESVPASLLRPAPVPADTDDSDESEEIEAAASDEALAEAPAPHLIGTDPEGFAVVEEVDGISEAGQAAQAAHEAAQDEELEARFRPKHHGDDDEEGDEEADQVEQLGGDAMEEMPMRPHRHAAPV